MEMFPKRTSERVFVRKYLQVCINPHSLCSVSTECNVCGLCNANDECVTHFKAVTHYCGYLFFVSGHRDNTCHIF